MLLAWHATASAFPPSLLPGPIPVFKRVGEIFVSGRFAVHMAATLLRVGAGFFLAFVVGIGLGIPLSIALSRYLVSQLYGVTPTDSLTLISSALIMMLVALLAGFLPARRAATVDPTIALRYE